MTRPPLTGQPGVGCAPVGLACLLALASIGCGPVQYLAQVGRAAPAIAQAEREGADVHAPYELTAAVAYLEKAREAASRSYFEDAVTYGDLAEQTAGKALALTRERKTVARTGRARRPVEGDRSESGAAATGDRPRGDGRAVP